MGNKIRNKWQPKNFIVEIEKFSIHSTVLGKSFSEGSKVSEK